MSEEVLENCVQELCRIFLGWKLGQDFDALLSLEEGALGIDLLSGECSCDGDPLPSLFIATELQTWLLGELERAGIPRQAIDEARIDALFAARSTLQDGRERAALRIGCRARIVRGDVSFEAEAHNS